MTKRNALKEIEIAKKENDVQKLDFLKFLIEMEMFLSKTEKNKKEWEEIYNLI